MERIALFSKVSLERFLEDHRGGSQEYKESVYDGIKLPKRATKGSAGYDFFAPENFTLAPGETILIPTGIRVRIEDGWVLKIYPRSSLGFKYRAQLDNTVGIIDSDYYYADNEGHIMIKLTNDSVRDNGKRGTTAVIEAGQGFAQGIFVPFGITEDDDTAEERRGGFGSTDKNNV